MEFERNRGGANGFGKSDNFFDRLALHVQCDQQRRNLRVGALAGENLGHDRVRFFARERLTVIGDAMEGVENHSIQATAEARHLSNRVTKKQPPNERKPKTGVAVEVDRVKLFVGHVVRRSSSKHSQQTQRCGWRRHFSQSHDVLGAQVLAV